MNNKVLAENPQLAEELGVGYVLWTRDWVQRTLSLTEDAHNLSLLTALAYNIGPGQFRSLVEIAQRIDPRLDVSRLSARQLLELAQDNLVTSREILARSSRFADDKAVVLWLRQIDANLSRYERCWVDITAKKAPESKNR